MSFIVKGMDMPKDCIDCPCESDTACQALDCELNGVPIYGKRDDCPLVEIPTPHGRLIDADALGPKLWGYERWTGIDEKPYEYAVDELGDAPTILEEEE